MTRLNYYEELKEAFRELEKRHEVVVETLCDGDQERGDFGAKLKEEIQYIVQAQPLKTDAYELLLQLY